MKNKNKLIIILIILITTTILFFSVWPTEYKMEIVDRNKLNDVYIANDDVINHIDGSINELTIPYLFSSNDILNNEEEVFLKVIELLEDGYEENYKQHETIYIYKDDQAQKYYFYSKGKFCHIHGIWGYYDIDLSITYIYHGE